MIIQNITNLPPGEGARFAWAGLRRYQNVSFVERQIMELQKVPESQRKNVTKQAQQLRYCITQALEYHRAANVVSLSTKPLMMYYSIMSFALAEILFKQDGNSSLDRIRGRHGHHGLELKCANVTPVDSDLVSSASMMKASPVLRAAGERYGTFELWHRTAREMPLGGEFIVEQARGSTRGFRPLLTPRDERFQILPETGMSLLSCYQSIPTMSKFLQSHGVQSAMVRAGISARLKDGMISSTYLFHPSPPSALEAVYSKIRIHPNDFESIDIHEFDSGCQIDIRLGADHPLKGSSFPNAIQGDPENIYFLGANDFLNEFGLFYVALYMLGNYARYFPDRWMVDVERSSPLALSALELMDAADRRVPLLIFSGLSRILWI